MLVSLMVGSWTSGLGFSPDSGVVALIEPIFEGGMVSVCCSRLLMLTLHKCKRSLRGLYAIAVGGLSRCSARSCKRGERHSGHKARPDAEEA